MTRAADGRGRSHAPVLLALGDSLTAGYGLRPDQAFAVRIEALLQDAFPGAIVRNAGVSRDTTADALRRLPRLLDERPLPDLAIVELGANDLLQAIPPARTRANLDAIVLALKDRGVPVLLATLDVPPAFAAAAGSYARIHADLAEAHSLASIPFFPPGVLGRRDLVLADGIHPNARAIDLIAHAMLPTLVEALAAGLSGAP